MWNKLFLTIFFIALNYWIYRSFPFKSKASYLILILGLVIPLFTILIAGIYSYILLNRFFPFDILFVLLFILSLVNIYRYYLSKIIIRDMKIGSQRISLPTSTDKSSRFWSILLITIVQVIIIWRDSEMLLSIFKN